SLRGRAQTMSQSEGFGRPFPYLHSQAPGREVDNAPCYAWYCKLGVRWAVHGTGPWRGGGMIVVVGLEFEARIAAGPGTQVICSGDGRHLAAALSRAITHDCRGLVSFGVAGGLAPELQPGDCVVGSAVLSGSARLETDRHWSRELLQIIPNAF